MDQPNYKLLSLLEKMVAYPSRVDVTIDCEGVFGFPEEWLKADEANPFFSYKFFLLNHEITGGKIQARVPTEEELAKIEEEKAAKGPKKPPPKKGYVEPQPTAEEIEAKRKAEEEKAERELAAQQEWDALSPTEQKWRTFENIHKKPAIRFELLKPEAGEAERADESKKQAPGTGNKPNPKENAPAEIKGGFSSSANGRNEKQDEEELGLPLNVSRKEGMDLVELEETVSAGGEWMFFYRYPNLPEEELAKTKKKLKAPLVNDLNPLVSRGWLDLRQFKSPGTTETTVRVNLEQVLIGDPNVDSNPYDLSNCYLKLRITVSPALFPMVTEVQPKVQDIIPKPPPLPKVNPSKKSIESFQEELRGAILKVADEYAAYLKAQMAKAAMGAEAHEEPGALALLKKHITASYFTSKQDSDVRARMRNDFLSDFQATGKGKT